MLEIELTIHVGFSPDLSGFGKQTFGHAKDALQVNSNVTKICW